MGRVGSTAPLDKREEWARHKQRGILLVDSMETIGIVQNGVVKLPAETHLPEGTRVRVVWPTEPEAGPIEREPLDEAAVLHDLQWANGRRFAK